MQEIADSLRQDPHLMDYDPCQDNYWQKKKSGILEDIGSCLGLPL